MASPVSPISTLFVTLANTASLKGRAKLLLGKARLAEGRSPPSIVMFPRKGPLSSPQYVGKQLDVDLEMVARIWGRDIDEAWDLRNRYLRGLWEQGQAGGVFWQGVGELWDDSADTSEQGQELEIIVNVRLQASVKDVQARALVENTSATLNAAISVDAGVSDAEIYVSSTLGYPPYGVIYVDDEKISYSAVTSISFVGCLRALGGTTPAAHVVGAVVSVTPSP